MFTLLQEKAKSTLEVDEDDILKLANCIQKNSAQDKLFVESLARFLNGEEIVNRPIVVGDTPNALVIAGAKDSLDLVISPRTIIKCMSEPEEKYHGHGLSREIMQQLPAELRNPLMVFKGSKEDSLVAITSLKDAENREIMIAVDLNSSNRHYEVNKVSSVYGRNNMQNYIKRQIENGNLIAMNKKTANEMLQSLGLQSPPEETFISYDDSIAYTAQNVKMGTSELDISEVNEEKEQFQVVLTSDAFPDSEDAYAIWDNSANDYYIDEDEKKVVTFSDEAAADEFLQNILEESLSDGFEMQML